MTRTDRASRLIAAPADRVFAALVDPEALAAWLPPAGMSGRFERFDATAGVVEDWMYEKLAESYVLDPENRAFLEQSNPWALHGIAGRLLEAADRALWAEPDPGTLAALRQAYLQTEGDLEGGT